MIGRIPILDVQPVLDCGRRPAKAVSGETFEVSATVFREGHERLGAGVVLADPAGRRQPLVTMHELAPGTDRYGAEVTVTAEGRWHFLVEAWGDPIAHWQHDAGIKVPRAQDVELMLTEGAILFDRAARALRPGNGDTAPPDEVRAARSALAAVAARLRDPAIPPWDRLAAASAPEVTAVLARWPLRELVTRSARYPVVVQRQRALYGAWYEFFPRSEGVQIDPMGRREPVSGTLRTAARRLPDIAAMGFDVVYLPPIHPIGTTHRKGRNNTLEAGPGDPGSPWAIGSADGGHDAIHPDLGTFADFDAFVASARAEGLEVALDLALQASPDHPWVKEHPEWFTVRADGQIAYAENPPKKYQDIYPLNFDRDPEGIYAEVLRIVRLWMGHGVRIFRVDNPHTKPLPFWERLLAEIARTDPDVILLAEAFTRPAMMHGLARIGFHQSYTYFTWRNTAGEITAYLRELAGPAAAYMRPNFFANTPDILSGYLQHAGPPAFRVRAALAALLAPSWGIYSGYELCENVPLRPGSEEYLDSEKYAYRPRDWAAGYGPHGVTSFITKLNMIRKSHPALHWLRNLRFHHVDQPDLICFSKRSQDGDDAVLVVLNLDPRNPREATVWLDMPALGMDPAEQFVVSDDLSGESYQWGQANYVRLDPAVAPAHIFTVTRRPPA
ncbi:MAG: alpha-1,4-glucan--maltose-1-phosphate maltosyltransferase [Actinobacteria bacterium]|nr:alpha-1,4-glucan--maltose-1-phosphate maltosyltransferase [Actinomycetota bacterium]MBO0784700.1 alpha-1,4-glucan--maltose-1-phosphate maltosyltransferase [Actinomycetota bacterium]